MPYRVILFGLQVLIEEIERGEPYTRSNWDEELIGDAETLESAEEMRAQWLKEHGWTDWK